MMKIGLTILLPIGITTGIVSIIAGLVGHPDIGTALALPSIVCALGAFASWHDTGDS